VDSFLKLRKDVAGGKVLKSTTKRSITSSNKSRGGIGKLRYQEDAFIIPVDASSNAGHEGDKTMYGSLNILQTDFLCSAEISKGLAASLGRLGDKPSYVTNSSVRNS